MIGRLPLRHRLTILVAVVASSLGLGIWMGATTFVPLELVPSLLISVIIGALSAVVLLHQHPGTRHGSTR